LAICHRDWGLTKLKRRDGEKDGKIKNWEGLGLSVAGWYERLESQKLERLRSFGLETTILIS